MSLRSYIVKRIAQILVIYWAFMTILFFMFRMLPGDPYAIYAQDAPPEARDEVIASLGLDQPLHIQYLDYFRQLLTGEFGYSFIYREPVSEIIFIKFWNTILLMGTALILAYLIGFFFGAMLGWYRGSNFEKTGLIGTLMARSSPEFWTSIVVLSVFAFWLGWFPAGGMRTPGADIAGFWSRYISWDFVYHIVLPVMAAVMFYLATPTLLMRTTMLDVLKADFIEIKKAEGIPYKVILYRHAARNSMLPLVTVAALVTGLAIGGSLVIETVFNWPGMGREMVRALHHHDYPVAQATFFLMGSVVIFMNLVADLLYVYLDPRVAYD